MNVDVRVLSLCIYPKLCRGVEAAPREASLKGACCRKTGVGARPTIFDGRTPSGDDVLREEPVPQFLDRFL
jgi:hypothetical protein